MPTPLPRALALRLVFATGLVAGALGAGTATAGGTVGVAAGGGKISIFSGDGLGQTVEVTVRRDGDRTFLRVEGKDGTRVGDADADPTVAEVELTPGAFDELSTDLGDGDDDLTLDLSGLPEDLRFRRVEVEDEGAASGDDTLTVRNASLAGSGDKIKVRLGPGDDTVNVEDCDASKVDVVDADGTNTTNVDRCNVDDELKVVGGRNHMVRVRDSFYGSAVIRVKRKGGVEPSLDARIERSSGASLDLRGADGDDVIFLDQVWTASLRVHGLRGDDSLFVTDSAFDRSTLIGGPDVDCYDVSNSTLGDPSIVASFDQASCATSPPPGPTGPAVRLAYAHDPLPAGSRVCMDDVSGACRATGTECVDGEGVPVPHVHDRDFAILIVSLGLTFTDLDPFGCGHGELLDEVDGCFPVTVPPCE